MADSSSTSAAERPSSQVTAGPVACPSAAVGTRVGPCPTQQMATTRGPPATPGREPASSSTCRVELHDRRPPGIGILLGQSGRPPLGGVPGPGEPDQAAVEADQADLDLARAEIDRQEQLARRPSSPAGQPPIGGEGPGHRPERRRQERPPGPIAEAQPTADDPLPDPPGQPVALPDPGRQEADGRPHRPGIQAGRDAGQARGSGAERRPEDDAGQVPGERRDLDRPVRLRSSPRRTHRSRRCPPAGGSSGTPNARPIGRVSA